MARPKTGKIKLEKEAGRKGADFEKKGASGRLV